VYLNQLRVEDARFEFLTALELKNNTLAGLNLVTLLIYQDDWSRAAELVSRLGLSPAQVTEAQARAQRLKAPATSAPTVAAQVAVATAPALQ
jgi:Flp pilus assembly protein TadD